MLKEKKVPLIGRELQTENQFANGLKGRPKMVCLNDVRKDLRRMMTNLKSVGDREEWKKIIGIAKTHRDVELPENE